MIDVALLFLRISIGILMLGHAVQKLFGWFGGGGIAGTFKLNQNLRLRPVWLWVVLVLACETGGSLLLIFGLFNPLGMVAICATMLMAAITVNWPRYWGSKVGIEYNILFVIPSIAIGLAGPGKYSLDAAIHFALPEPAATLLGLVLAVLGVIIALATRRPR
ncbi:MAG TPA: DoxX family protein [Ktedonobacteraceae bacterium]|jgi:putative oxidoreductase|nr:DoxX family protein [Ktedonobacteraceae bacterium]